ncbi:MAG: class I SAM-dependent methyltransferase [Verrucomicrobiota bacterium]
MTETKPHEDPSIPRSERIASLGFDLSAQPSEFAERCNLCGAENWTVITHRDRYGYPARTTVCNECGLAVMNPRMTAEAYGGFYESVYRPLVSAYHGRRIDAVTVQAEQQTYSDELERMTAEYLDPKTGSSFLDVGGSTGVVAVHLAKRFKLRPTVLDPAPDEIAEAENLGLETIEALVEDWDPEEKKYDIIGMFQTIDHLLDVKGTLRKLRSAVADDGLFIVDVVDFRAAYLKNWSVEAATKIDHPFSLTEDTAEAYLADAGFEPVRKAYSEDHHLVLYICRPCEPNPGARPSPESVDRFFREIRFVQNAPRPGGAP